jgi:hypothetical protein
VPWRGHVPAAVAVAVVCAVAPVGPVDLAPRAAAGGRATLIRVDADSGRVRAVLQLPARARDVLVSGGQIWTNAEGRLLRVDPRTNRVHLVARDVAGLTVAGNEVWAALRRNQLVQFDGRTGARRRSLRLSSRPLFAVGDAGFPAVADDSVWLTVPKLGDPREPHALWRLDRRSGRVQGKLAIGVNPTPPFAAFGSLFIVNAPRIGRNTLLRVRPAPARVVEVATPGSPWGLTAGVGALWVGGRVDRVVWRLEPRTARPVATVGLPELAGSRLRCARCGSLPGRDF